MRAMLKNFVVILFGAVLSLGFYGQDANAILKGSGGATSAANITSGTISGASGVALVLNQGGIPFISLSSGSVAANGAISGITALSAIYPDAYCYFPANALATVKAAGWYYCTFSTTTAGVAFLDSYTSGAPTIPASPSAVTDGKGAFTGDTGEEFGPTFTVPALNATSLLRVTTAYTNTNNANVKTYRTRLSGNAGTIFISTLGASIAGGAHSVVIANTGSASKQVTNQIGAANGATATLTVLGTVATGVSTTLVFSLQKATATDNMVLHSPPVELFL